MTPRPPEDDDDEDPPLTAARVGLIVVAVLPAVILVSSMIWMGHSQLAFDETRCPWRRGVTREVTDRKSVREDSRRCQPDVAEHRWILIREGREPVEMGRRRLELERWGRGYRWAAREDAQGRVRVDIHCPGLDVRRFREPAPDSGMGD